MKLIAIVKTYGVIEDKDGKKEAKPYVSRKVVATETYKKSSGAEVCNLVVCKCAEDFALPVGTDFEPVYDRFGRIVGKR